MNMRTCPKHSDRCKKMMPKPRKRYTGTAGICPKCKNEGSYITKGTRVLCMCQFR